MPAGRTAPFDRVAKIVGLRQGEVRCRWFCPTRGLQNLSRGWQPQDGLSDSETHLGPRQRRGRWWVSPPYAGSLGTSTGAPVSSERNTASKAAVTSINWGGEIRNGAR